MAGTPPCQQQTPAEGTPQPLLAYLTLHGKPSLLQLCLPTNNKYSFPRVNNNRRRKPYITVLSPSTSVIQQAIQSTCLVTTVVHSNKAVTAALLVGYLALQRDSGYWLTSITAQQGYGQPPPGQYGAPRGWQSFQWLDTEIHD